MGKLIDLTGKTFTYLKVISRGLNKKNHVAWLCECICGKQKLIKGGDLRNKKTKGCGSYCSYEPRKRIEGKKYGRLTVLRLVVGERSKEKESRPLWEVRCECSQILKPPYTL